MRNCLSLVILVFLLSSISFAQSRDLRPHTEYGTVEGDLRCKYEFYHDQWSERDVKHGRYSEWATGDRLMMDGWYFDGLQDSIWKFWYINGELREVSNWEAGHREGKTLTYDKEGRVTAESSYKAGTAEGLQIQFFPNGKVKSIAQYRNGVPHGNVTTYNSRGIRKRIRQFEEGKEVRMDKTPADKAKPEQKPDKNPSKEAPKEKISKPEKQEPKPTEGTPPLQPSPKKPDKKYSIDQPQQPVKKDSVPSPKSQPWENNNSPSSTKKLH